MTEETNPQTAPEAQAEVQPVQSGLIAFAEPVVTETAIAAPPEAPPETPEPPKNGEPINSPALNAAAMAEARHAAENEEVKREFARKVLEARAKHDVKIFVQPVAPRIMAQTLAEQEAGRRMNAYHAAFHANAPQPRREDNGSMTPVFRPADYVPDQKKGQGYVEGRVLR